MSWNFIDGFHGFWTGLRGRLGTDSHTRDYPVIYNYGNLSPISKAEWEVVSGNEFTLYNTTPELYIVFNRFAGMFSNGRWVHKKSDGTEKGKVIEDSPVISFLEKPNPLQSGDLWKMESALHYLIFGNHIAYVLFPTSLSPLPRLMNNLPPAEVKIKLTGNRWDETEISGIIEKYILRPSGTNSQREFDPQEIIHHQNVDPNNPIIGSSIMHSLRMPISNIRAAYGFRNVNISKRGALGFVTNKSKDASGSMPLQVNERKRIEDQWSQQTHGIFDGQSTVVISDNELGWESTAYPINKMMLFEEISEDMKKIIDAVGLNDNIFSKEKSKVQANLSEGLKMAYQDSIIPFAQSFASAITSGLRLPDDEWLELDYSHIPALKEDEKSKAEIDNLRAYGAAQLVKAGFTTKEVAKMMGLEPK